ncbi:MAG: twin transmembrane helix small protein [Methylococcaceae bacterium]|nr:twin transmembrane helix small protein [Methylococcaceae bacterium]
MPIKVIFIIVFISILISLGSALFNLVKYKDQEDSKKTVKALTFRIGLSILLFIALYISYATGLIEPTGIGKKMHMVKPGQQQNTNQKNKEATSQN